MGEDDAVNDDKYEPLGGIAKLFQWSLLDKKFPQGEIVEFLIEGPAGTGKSRGTGELAFQLMETFSRSRGLVVRKTRKALSESWMATFEERVLWPGHYMIGSAKRRNRHGYDHENGSTVVMGTMESPTNLYSTDWDWILYEEAQQSSLDEWEKFKRALRSNRMPFQLLIGNANPDSPRHYLNQRCIPAGEGIAPQCNRIITRHADNPSLRPAYLQSLSELTGVRRRRLFLGEWCETVGAVLPEFDAAVHMVFREQVPYHPAIHGERDGAAVKICGFYGAVDWGYNDPGVFTVWALDDQNELWMVGEVYRTRQGIPFWADTAVELDKRFKFERIFCDPSQPAMIELFNASIGAWRGRNSNAEGVACKANNEWLGGIEAVRERLIGRNGRPTLHVIHDSLISGRDEDLVAAFKPYCLAMELPEYCYKLDVDGKPQNGRGRDEEAKSSVAHAIDTARYICLSMVRQDVRVTQIHQGYIPGTYGDLARHWEIFDDEKGVVA